MQASKFLIFPALVWSFYQLPLEEAGSQESSVLLVVCWDQKVNLVTIFAKIHERVECKNVLLKKSYKKMCHP